MADAVCTTCWRWFAAQIRTCPQEALQNVQKYANASQVVAELHEDDGQLRFAVTDDGQGFDVATAKRGAGLTNMADRLDALGGSIEVSSRSGAGTCVRGALPALERVEALA